MALNLINIEPSEILDLLKTAFYEQTGETIQIGSNEFATASTQAYVWSVLLNSINDNTQNRFIDSATGSFLDAIAANYGITQRPDGYHATARFLITPVADNMTIPANSLVISDNAGNKFTNPYTLYVPENYSSLSVVMQSVESGTKYNGIPANEITVIDEGEMYITAARNLSMTTGGTDGYPYTVSGDDAYREWLKTEIQSFAGAGTYQAYEARAKNADSRVLGVYVLRQDDEGYEKGKVQIYIYTDSEYDIDSQVLSIVQNSCSDPSFRPIGDLVVVDYSPLTDVDISVLFQITYPEKFRGVADQRNERIFNAYHKQLAESINKPFSFEEFCSLLVQKDEFGVYALDAKPMSLTQAEFAELIYPEPGGRLSIGDISFVNTFSGVA